MMNFFVLVWCMDEALPMTKLLLNSGASAWSGEQDQSAFSWFVRVIVKRRSMDNCMGTLHVLALAMADSPKRMHSHVLRTMFRQVMT